MGEVWDSNLANSCSVREKTNFLKCTFLQIFTFFQLLFSQWLRKQSILTQITIHTR